LKKIIDNKPVHLKPQNCNGKEGTKKQWPDLSVCDLVYCPESLNDMCAYEIMIHYERFLMDARKTGKTFFPFLDDHPSSHAVYLKQMKTMKIPIITASDGFQNIKRAPCKLVNVHFLR
jgi:hypothetical protein